MADNLTITPGTGASIATDDVSNVHFQRIKLVDGTLDSTAAIPGDATDGLRVNTRGGGLSISQTPTITAGAYSAKDCVGGLLTFANAARKSGGKGIINTVTIIDNDDEGAGLELWLFNADPTVQADNAPMDFSDANMLKCVGVISISSANYYSLADNGATCLRGVGLQFQCAVTSLFGQLKCIGTPTYTGTNDLTIILGVEYLD